MRIALICPNLLPCPPIRSGAIELLIDRTAPYLARLNYQVSVFSIQDESLANHELVNGVEFIRYPKETYLQDVLLCLKKQFFDLIQVYNNHQWIEAIKRSSPKSLLTLSLHNSRLGNTVDDEKSIQIINAVDHIFTVSNFLAKEIMNRYPASTEKVTTLYTGEDPSCFITHFGHKGQEITRQMKQALGIPHDYQIVLFVGRLVEYKGCHYLIQAMKRVIQQYAKTALVIVGSRQFGNVSMNNYVNKLKKTAAKISKHIYFTNFIPVNKIPNYYTMSDIFVCPSQWQEPLARVLYEAMAAGLPIITTNRGGNPEVVVNGKNGFVVGQYNEPSAFANAINELLSNEKIRKAFGSENRNLVCERYNFEQYVLNLVAIYEKLARKKV